MMRRIRKIFQVEQIKPLEIFTELSQYVRCNVSGVTCNIFCFVLIIDLVGGRSVINGAYPVSKALRLLRQGLLLGGLLDNVES